MNFILTATRKADNFRLHLLNRYTPYQSWVVCWNYYPTNDTWDWGSYCNDLKEALSIFNQRLTEHDFDDVFEGYV